MVSDIIEINTLRMKFKNILNLIDKAINQSKAIQIPKTALKQNSNNMLFLKWLHKHKIIELTTFEKFEPKKISIRSRRRKIEIALQLKALDHSESEIAQKFSVKKITAQSYLKEIGKYDADYMDILRVVLEVSNITNSTPLNNFSEFPIRIDSNKIEKQLSTLDYKDFKLKTENNKWVKFVVGQNLGTYDVSILLPEKS